MEKGKWAPVDVYPELTRHTQRAHARTTRNHFRVKLRPPTSDGHSLFSDVYPQVLWALGSLFSRDAAIAADASAARPPESQPDLYVASSPCCKVDFLQLYAIAPN